MYFYLVLFAFRSKKHRGSLTSLWARYPTSQLSSHRRWRRRGGESSNWLSQRPTRAIFRFFAILFTIFCWSQWLEYFFGSFETQQRLKKQPLLKKDVDPSPSVDPGGKTIRWDSLRAQIRKGWCWELLEWFWATWPKNTPYLGASGLLFGCLVEVLKIAKSYSIEGPLRALPFATSEEVLRTFQLKETEPRQSACQEASGQTAHETLFQVGEWSSKTHFFLMTFLVVSSVCFDIFKCQCLMVSNGV